MIVHSSPCDWRVILGACCVLSGWAATAHALVTIQFVESNSDASAVNVPLHGGSYDIAVVLISDEQARGVSGMNTSLVSSMPGLITLSGVIGGQGSTGQGTRYNNPLWEHRTDGGAQPPGSIAGPLGTTPRFGYGTVLGVENPSFHVSTMGWIRVGLAPAGEGTSVSFMPTDAIMADITGERLPVSLQGVTFSYIPEPITAAGILMGIGLLRFRSARTAGVKS